MRPAKTYLSILAACIRGAIKGTIVDNSLIKMNWHARTKAKAQGLDLSVASLDAYTGFDENNEREEPYATPITPTAPVPEPDLIKRAKAEEYLSYLPPRTQTILRLRFGLSDEDERAYSVIEIAGILGLSREVVNLAIHDGIARLRALVEGKATIWATH
jgi:DNA-directed RNA polymerase sigma subunit (sigma70/sigma32)